MAGIGQFQPLFPEERVSSHLYERTASLIQECSELQGQAGPWMIQALSPLLRAMNSYYTNRIEGQHTHPTDIERALLKQFDSDKILARKQRMAIAHMEVEQEMESLVGNVDARTIFSADHVCQIHRRLYGKLPAGDRLTDEGVQIVPGEIRAADVVVARHRPPDYKDIPELLEAWGARYRALPGREATLIGLACSHHRLAWVHPFIDGNGRTARLHSHLVLHAMGLTRGLWSPMRGLARTHEAYYARLNNADLSRRNDLDGRGLLSQEELVNFAGYFLDVCLDQVKFMKEQLEFDKLKMRLKTLLLYLQANPWRAGSEKSLIRIEVLEPLHYVAIAGPLDRTRFFEMIGLEDRPSRRILASLIDYGILKSDTHRSPVRFAIPHKSLQFLFPNLWPEAEGSK